MMLDEQKGQFQIQEEKGNGEIAEKDLPCLF